MTNSTSYNSHAFKGTDYRSASAAPSGGIKRWCISICSVIMGLLALFFFLFMGGVFALFGPWVVLAGTLAATRHSGGQVLSFISGGAFLCLAAAALFLPGHAGNWGTIGGVLGLLGGSGYIAAMRYSL